jgi:hypothetical protein
VDSILWAAVIAGAIAATAVIANVRMTRLTLAHQRDRSYEDRHWQAVADLYVDILLQEKDYGETISRTMSVNEGTVDWQRQLDRVASWQLLHARVDVFPSDAVRERFLAWRAAYVRYTTAILDDRRRHGMVDFTSIPAGEMTAEPHRVAYWAAEATLRELIRSEMNGLRRADAAAPAVSWRRAVRWRR